MGLARGLSRRAVPLLALGVIACGGGSSSPSQRADPPPAATASPAPPASPAPARPVSRREAAVIRGWTSSLRHGHVKEASRYFAVPAVVANGTPPVRLQTRAQVDIFNRALSCGAVVVSLERSEHDYVLAEFRLTERPGGNCGTGTGHPAWAAFLVTSGHIVQWLRVPDPASGVIQMAG
jgi:hypothetical protein